MMYLLDTNVISEVVKPKPHHAVISWLESIESMHFAISVISLGEIRKGVERLDAGKRKKQIIQWLELDLVQQFEDRILFIDSLIADKWGYLTSLSNIPAIDALLAATALVHNLKLVTRNVKDFKSVGGLELVDPWGV